jgi:hypothetical protein
MTDHERYACALAAIFITKGWIDPANFTYEEVNSLVQAHLDNIRSDIQVDKNGFSLLALLKLPLK